MRANCTVTAQTVRYACTPDLSGFVVFAYGFFVISYPFVQRSVLDSSERSNDPSEVSTAIVFVACLYPLLN